MKMTEEKKRVVTIADVLPEFFGVQMQVNGVWCALSDKDDETGTKKITDSNLQKLYKDTPVYFKK